MKKQNKFHFQPPRFYLLRTGPQMAEENSLSLFGQLSPQEKPFACIKKEGEKALRYGYHRLLLPWNFPFHPEKDPILAWIKKYPQLFSLSLHKKSVPAFQKIFPGIPAKKLILDLILEEYDSDLLDYMESLRASFQITVPAHKKLNIEHLSHLLSQRYKKEIPAKTFPKTVFSLREKLPFFSSRQKNCFPSIYFHFPFSHENHPQLYSAREIYQFLQKNYYSPPPVGIYNMSTPKDLKLLPEREPEIFHSTAIQKSLSSTFFSSLKFFTSTPELMASVIIPTYNNKEELKETLRHLFHQDLAKEKWEIIVIDDGSEDGTAQDLKNLNFLPQLNFKFIFLSGKQKNGVFWNHRFRAGVARNLGARYARGKFLFFLDSDILTPPQYLSSALKKLETSDILQHPRYHLKKTAPKNYEKIERDKHCWIKGVGYFEKFYDNAQDWNQKRLPWKYISTNSLCIRKSVFQQMGGFRKNYTCYGFEDTDLGYRLHQAGFHFKLNKLPVYHLYCSSENSSQKRKCLMVSARLFFHNNHDLVAYEEFEPWINNEH